MKIKTALVVLLFNSFYMISQNVKERAQIIKSNNQVELQRLIIDLQEKELKDQENVLDYSKENNISIFRANEDGSFDQLMRITEEGIPVYYSLDNTDAANSTRANRMHSGGFLGLNVEGQGMTAYVWDGGAIRIDHQEFSGGRATKGDAAVLDGNSFHATHVSGTIAASGVDPDAKGMAPQANIITSDWNNDSSEMASAAANGALISNHSYGVDLSSFSRFPEAVGKYRASAQTVDNITRNAPYYLPVFSAGNSGGDNTSNSNPIDRNFSFDKLTGDKVAKNSMIVANAQDAVLNSTNGSLIFVQINPGSSEGPTDDLRIKPDIAGNGTQLYSTFDGSTSSYGTISGTSMSSPNVAGSLLLLQQYYNEKNGVFMRASSLKGLACHTADDAGISGPDAVFGWGLMNTMEAANAITNDKLTSRIVEAELFQGDTYSITVDSDNVSSLLASISWTDVPGAINTAGSNDGTPALVNDLDIRISQNTTIFEPWKLTGVNSNTQGDNTVDNFERVEVGAASGTYTITVTHKGTLVTGSQKFSLIVTGEVNNYAISSSVSRLEVCNDEIVTIPISFLSSSNFNETAVLSLQGLPSSASFNFSTNNFSNTGNSTLTIDNLNTLSNGFYDLSVNATTPTETKTIEMILRVLSNSNFPASSILFPIDQATGVSTTLTLDWDDNINAQEYDLEISRSSTFAFPEVSETISDSQFIVQAAILDPSSTYFWRVKPKNQCGEGSFATFSFTTFQCNETPSPFFTPISIPDNTTNGIQNTITVNEPNNIVIGQLSVYVESVHEYSGDLVIYLTSPSGVTAQLKTSNGCATPDVDVTFEDGSAPFVCNTTFGQAGYFGSVEPIDDLSVFAGETINGNWILTVNDEGPTDLGTLNDWSITFCETPAILSNEEIVTNELVVYPNPSNGLFTIEGSEVAASNAVINLLDLNGRIVFTKEIQNTNRLNETIDVQNLTNGLYLLQVQQGASQSVQKIVIKK